jgi:hypothetical protein
LKSWILDGLEESLQGSLRNGHLHTDAHNPRSPEARRIMVMAETQMIARVCSIHQALARPTDPPGLRRLRFPFFKPTCQRAMQGQLHLRQPNSAGCRDESPPPGSPDVNLVVGREDVAQ